MTFATGEGGHKGRYIMTITDRIGEVCWIAVNDWKEEKQESTMEGDMTLSEERSRLRSKFGFRQIDRRR